MKAFKDRDKRVKLLQKELRRIHSCPSLNIRRCVKRANDLLNDIIDHMERYDSDLLSIQAVKVKNAYLARALQKERERSNTLLQEKNQLQAAFHELRIEKIELKRDKTNLERMLLSDIEDFKKTLPNIIQLSELYSTKIMKYDAIKKKISCGRFSNISFGNPSTPPVSAVNPMVQGYVIQKPTINVRRVSVPNETRSSMFDYVNINSPISEGNEELASPANNPTRRCGNGFRNVLNISNRRRKEGPPPPASTTDENYCDNVADGEQSDVVMEPVVRLEDVTRLLQHSSIRISEPATSSPATHNARGSGNTNEHWSPDVLVPKISTPVRSSLNTLDNPLEGCSWMHQRLTPGGNDNRVPSASSQRSFRSHQNKSLRSPLFPKSPFGGQQGSSTPNTSTQIDGPPATDLTFTIANNNEDVDVVSSSKLDVDDEALPVGITRRKRKRSAGSRSRSRSGESTESEEQNEVALVQKRRSHCLRRSTRLSCRVGDVPDTSPADTLPKVSKVRGKSKERVETRNVSLNDSDVSVVQQGHATKRCKKDSKSNLSVSNVSSSDLDDSSRQSRPRRNRGVVSFKEPSLNTKLRRN